MAEVARDDVTQHLSALTGGDGPAAGRLMELIYGELRALAGNYFRNQPAGVTLQPTALVHEAFVKVAGNSGARFEDRAHFFAVCAVTMRSILADAARRRNAAKRGGDRQRVTLGDAVTASGGEEVDALALDAALTELAARSERQARVIEYRFFGGMTVEESARVLGVARSTVEEDWRMARAWLTVQLRKGDPT